MLLLYGLHGIFGTLLTKLSNPEVVDSGSNNNGGFATDLEYH